jgi:hypothetical protein
LAIHGNVAERMRAESCVYDKQHQSPWPRGAHAYSRRYTREDVFGEALEIELKFESRDPGTALSPRDHRIFSSQIFARAANALQARSRAGQRLIHSQELPLDVAPAIHTVDPEPPNAPLWSRHSKRRKRTVPGTSVPSRSAADGLICSRAYPARRQDG